MANGEYHALYENPHARQPLIRLAGTKWHSIIHVMVSDIRISNGKVLPS